MTDKLKGTILKCIAVFFFVAVPIIAIYIQFPIWIDRGAGSTVSGVAVILMLLALKPIFKIIKKFFESPSAIILWAVGLVILWVLDSIAGELIPVFLIGVISSAIGEPFWLIGKRFCNRD